jgi:hypothetical protein
MPHKEAGETRFKTVNGAWAEEQSSEAEAVEAGSAYRWSIRGWLDGREMVIDDVTAYAMEPSSVGPVDAHDADPALDRQRRSRRLAAMRRNLERAVEQFPWSEHSLGTAVESITT